MSEIWDIYTIDRKVTGRTVERGKHYDLGDDDFHLWVMCWIKNPVTGKYLISQRSADKDTDPLKWETVAGHAVKGDSGVKAAVREVLEEVGIEFEEKDARRVFVKVAKTIDGKRHNWIRDSYYFETTQEPNPSKALTPDEVIKSKWVTFDEFKTMYESGLCCANMGDLYGLELNPVPKNRYSNIIGKVVKGKIDRPLGSKHPRHHEMIYPVNYGFVDGVMGGDGAEQDVYLLGTDKPCMTYTGKVIGVYHRYDDNETKWIVVPSDENGNVLPDVKIPSEDEIYAQIAFQEQYFSGLLVL